MQTILKNISLLILTAAVMGGANGEQVALANAVESSTEDTASTRRGATVRERYECVQNGDKYSTVAHTARGPIEIIVWESTFFGAKWTPAVRCQAVSKRFQALSDQGRLKYLNAGRMNYENVICVTSKTGKEGCLKGGLLLTLEPKDNPFDVLNDLFYSRQNPSAGGTRRNNGKPIDFVRLLNERAPMAQSSDVPTTPEVVPNGKGLEGEKPVPGQPIPWGQ
ncbi:COP23 domain-containing protein [Acaryochloris sp. IP29b_bin.148]|uniref:COP23 domain-containing protein n=1 Tax=Acaryochloris sp. IP29b_bin.148 TaxID=2969218 RepID=UPI0026051D64|nr:COP23 domain-containing protein [Acaryochloris sp. IP29b_bin.148]